MQETSWLIELLSASKEGAFSKALFN